MSKMGVAAATMGVGGTGAAGTYAAYHYGVFGGGTTAEAVTPPAPVPTQVKHDKSVKELTKHDGKQCLAMAFNNWIQTWTGGNIEDDDSLGDIGSLDDLKLDASSTGRTAGCLEYAVNSEDKPEGRSFRFLWASSKDTKGFAVYMTATYQPEKTVEFNGAVYAFEKDDNKWKTHKKKKIEAKVLSGEDLKNNFPKKHPDFLKSSKMNDYWNLLDDEGSELRNEAFRRSGWHIFSYPDGGAGTDSLTEWSSNLDVWWKYFFGDELGKISEAVGEVKGKWVG